MDGLWHCFTNMFRQKKGKPTLWLLNIAMERSTIFKNGKPSISMGHLYHGELLIITRGYGEESRHLQRPTAVPARPHQAAADPQTFQQLPGRCDACGSDGDVFYSAIEKGQGDQEISLDIVRYIMIYLHVPGS